MNKMMIVDDSTVMRQVILRALRQADIAVETILEACDGVEALATLTEHPDIQLIVSDMTMPNMNGIELVQGVRKIYDAETMPIVIISSEKGETIRAKALSEGANRYVGKPFTPASLKAALEPYLS